MKESFERNRRFFVAVMLAAIYGIKRFTWREIFAAVKMMLIALTSKKGKASRQIYYRRMKHCMRCPIYVSATMTCGSPISNNPELGCLCFLPKKNAVAAATCWANHHTDLNFGWPPELELDKR